MCIHIRFGSCVPEIVSQKKNSQNIFIHCHLSKSSFGYLPESNFQELNLILGQEKMSISNAKQESISHTRSLVYRNLLNSILGSDDFFFNEIKSEPWSIL